MKILVLSDSHGDMSNMRRAVEESLPDMIIHLGDCRVDAMTLQSEYQDIDLEYVSGNCDYYNNDAEKILTIHGKRILMCHGHAYGVKFSLLNIEMTSYEKNVDVTLFGHTHKVFYDNHNGLVMLNPGSIGSPPIGLPASYGLLYINEDGSISTDVKYIE